MLGFNSILRLSYTVLQFHYISGAVIIQQAGPEVRCISQFTSLLVFLALQNSLNQLLEFCLLLSLLELLLLLRLLCAPVSSSMKTFNEVLRSRHASSCSHGFGVTSTGSSFFFIVEPDPHQFAPWGWFQALKPASLFFVQFASFGPHATKPCT